MNDLLGQLGELIDRARETSLSGLAANDLTQLVVHGETLLRQWESVMRGVVAEMDRRGVAGEYGASSTRDLLRQLLLVTQHEAGARVRQAKELKPRVGLTGELLPPLFAATGAALDMGSISLAHAKIITTTRSALPAKVDAEHGDAAEEFLVDQASRLDPVQLNSVARRLLDTLNPDGKFTEEQDQERRRHFALVENRDGSSTPRGRFTPELTMLIKPALDALSAPQPGDHPDTRTPGQRSHDALIEAAMLLLRSDALPSSGGVPVSVIVTVSEADLRRAEQGEHVLVEDSFGGLISLDTIAKLTAELDFTAITLSTEGGILSYGRTRRLATCAQRRALAVRDKGCSFPGCDRRAAWCEAHHIREWLRGGETNLDNLVLLCRYHHRSFEKAGWTVRMSRAQVPEWIPPRFVDPEQRPRRNTAHDRPPIPVLT